MPISGLVVTFSSEVVEHAATVELLRSIPELDIGESSGCRLAIVIDTDSQRRDREIWTAVQQLPGVVELAVAMVAFDDDGQQNDSQADC